MTAIVSDLRDLGTGAASQVRRGVAVVRRTTPGIALLRVLVGGCLFGAAWLSLPGSITQSRAVAVPLLLATVCALFPRTRLVTATLMLITVSWIVATGRDWVPLQTWRVLALAALLYVAHAAATLAAVLPHDSAVAARSLGRWLVRTAGVTATGLGVGLFGLVLASNLETVPSLIGPIVGTLLAGVIVGLIVWQLRRR